MKIGLIILIVVVGATSVAVVARLLREPFRFTATGIMKLGPPTIALLSMSIVAIELYLNYAK